MTFHHAPEPQRVLVLVLTEALAHKKHMSAPLPQVGSGEPVGDLMQVLGTAYAAIVLVEGKPTGVVSRQDLLAFLAKGGK